MYVYMFDLYRFEIIKQMYRGSDKESTKTSRRSLMEAEGEVTPANNADAGTDRKHGSKHP